MPNKADTGDLKTVLRDAGLRATSARVAVLECLMASQSPLTHAEVCERLSRLAYDRATLYRNLVDLTEVGLATRSDHGDHLWRFEMAGQRAHADTAHPHFVCSECGDVSCLPEDAVAFRPTRGVPESVRSKQVDIQVRGVCNDCS